jgi:hypothetical protein
VVVVIMPHEGITILKMFVAVLAIEMAPALNPMFLQAQPCGKINTAAVANVMDIGVLLVLVESTLMAEISIAAFAISHRG